MPAAQPPSHHAVATKSRARSFTLDNGMDVVVIPDHRAPIVSHMVWYRVGGADEPEGASGIAHFLEHLMFKGTEKIAAGEFSKIVARYGGTDNAFTSQDVTAYYQDVAKDRLPLVMELESDRMRNLQLAEKDVLTERDVILEERRMRVDNDPAAKLSEQMDAVLYANHPYGAPVIGWEHEIAVLSRDDALAFYRRFYAPNNAILVVAGDVEPDAVLALARDTYGKLPKVPEIEQRQRPKEPPPVAARHIRIDDPRAGQATIDRDYHVPSYATAEPGEAEAIDILVRIFGSGSTSRLYRKLLVAGRKVASVGAYYTGHALDSGKVSVYATANDGVELGEIERGIDAIIGDIATHGVTREELDRAVNLAIADFVYEADSLTALARRYGWRLSTGSSIRAIETWPERIRSVTLDEVREAARHLDKRASVTGWLVPTEAAVADASPPVH